MEKDWAVYAKPCIQKTETIIAYLARYTHRTALSDQRIQSIDGDRVRLSYKDYRDHNHWKTMILSAEELLRRFLLHVLPKGLMRIRHYGLMANRCRKSKLAQIRACLKIPAVVQKSVETSSETVTEWPCPVCHQGDLHCLSEIMPMRTDRPAVPSG